MTEAIQYEQFDQTASQAGAVPSAEADLNRLADIPMELSVEIGRTHMTVGETLDLRVGSVVTLERLAGQTADLLVNGTAIARGEVVVIDEQYGLRITEILDSQQDAVAPVQATEASPAGSPEPAGAGLGSDDQAPAARAGGPESEASQAPPAPEA